MCSVLGCCGGWNKTRNSIVDVNSQKWIRMKGSFIYRILFTYSAHKWSIHPYSLSWVHVNYGTTARPNTSPPRQSSASHRRSDKRLFEAGWSGIIETFDLPDLALCGFFFFPTIKNKMLGLRYNSANTKHSFLRWLQNSRPSAFRTGFIECRSTWIVMANNLKNNKADLKIWRCVFIRFCGNFRSDPRSKCIRNDRVALSVTRFEFFFWLVATSVIDVLAKNERCALTFVEVTSFGLHLLFARRRFLPIFTIFVLWGSDWSKYLAVSHSTSKSGWCFF